MARASFMLSDGYDKSERVYARLKAIVVAYGVPPRQHLRIRHIADRMRVSPTPVREAFLRLTDERLLTFEPGYGFYANMLTPREIEDDYSIWQTMGRDALLSIRGRFELPRHAQFAAADEIDVSSVETCARDVEALFRQVAKLKDNPRVMQIAENFLDRTAYIRRLGFEIFERRLSASSEVSKLAEALRIGDNRTAVATFDRLNAIEKRHLGALVKEGNARALERTCELGPISG